MKKRLLRPEQIITLRDYPVHNEHILKIYFRVFREGQGKILPPCPVIHKSVAVPYMRGKRPTSRKSDNLLERYLEDNPHAEYFLLDGGHKTAAATLSHKNIPVLVVETDDDLRTCRKLVDSGEFFGWHRVPKSVNDATHELAKHHHGTERFMTVEDKVKKMIHNKDVPQYMIRFYKKRR